MATNSGTTNGGNKPLTGVRIIDFTVAWAGPMAGRILAYLGAEVIHIEGPSRVDTWRDTLLGGDLRRYADCEYGRKPYNRSSKFNSQNLGKRAISVDLKSAEGRTLLQELARYSDALITNFRPGTLDKLGIGYAELHDLNQGIVVVEMPAYGLSGPKSAQAGYGPSMEGASGMASMVGYGDGRPYGTGPAYLDATGALNGAAAVLTGLVDRQSSGSGKHIEVAQCEAAMHWVGEWLLASIDRSEPPRPEGNVVDYAEPHEAFPCAGEDNWLAMGIITDDDWEDACSALGLTELAEDDRFADALARRRNRAALYEALASATRSRDKNELAQLLQAAGVAAAPVCNGSDMARRADLWQSGFFELLDHPSVGMRWYQGLAMRYGETLLTAERSAPEFGQDNRYVAMDVLGMTADQFASLERRGVMTPEPAIVMSLVR
jgi:crotonobetainyl-CoA:carnitine CoA-transferase CaiB-like acyl-CoA transferase